MPTTLHPKLPPLETLSPSPKPRILLVEDDELIRETVTLALEDEGYEVQSLGDGRLALELLYRITPVPAAPGLAPQDSGSPLPQPHLIILDLMLPLVNGLDLCRLIRHQGNRIPILILSAKGTESDRVVGLEVGADDYLPKPFGMRELVARCRALLRRSQGDSPWTNPEDTTPALRFQDISLYPTQCRVTVAGQEVNLSPKEFRLLELFLKYPRRVWSRDQLLERVWGMDFMGDSKTVDVHIRWLREKLEQDPRHPQYLQTVRGFGYRLGS
jgi:two-component system, OmpR family, phosphate regulon response regulator PhoB